MSTANLKYTEEHEWVRLEGEVAVIGVTSHATEELGEIVYTELTDKGTTLDRTDEFGSIESVKTVSGLFSPISGEVVDVNQAVIETPETITNSPYEEGWLVKIKPSDASELDELMDESSYKSFLDDL